MPTNTPENVTAPAEMSEAAYSEQDVEQAFHDLDEAAGVEDDEIALHVEARDIIQKYLFSLRTKLAAAEKLLSKRANDLESLGTVAEKHGWNGTDNSKILSNFLDYQLQQLSTVTAERDRMRAVVDAAVAIRLAREDAGTITEDEAEGMMHDALQSFLPQPAVAGEASTKMVENGSKMGDKGIDVEETRIDATVRGVMKHLLDSSTDAMADDFDEVEKYIKSLRSQLAAVTAERDDLRSRKDNAYWERNQCVALLAKFAQAMGFTVGTKKTAIEGWDAEWHNCVYIDLPTGQISWHYHDDDAPGFAEFSFYRGEWDGHDTAEKYRRVRGCVVRGSQAPAPADGEVRPTMSQALADYERRNPDKPQTYDDALDKLGEAIERHPIAPGPRGDS